MAGALGRGLKVCGYPTILNRGDKMKADLQQKFYDRWIAWFSGRFEGPQHNLMCFGFDHGDGWFDLEWHLCEDLEKILGEYAPAYKLFQIKEKFGTLRWYDEVYGRAADVPADVMEKIRQRVHEAEEESAKTCEMCGDSGILCSSRSWVQTLCPDCDAALRRAK